MKIERTIVATLKLDTAVHIGRGKGNHPTDSPLRRTGEGRLLISGRTIGGSLRSTATRLAPRVGLEPCKALWSSKEIQAKDKELDRGKACLCPVCRLFGDLYPDELNAEEGGG